MELSTISGHHFFERQAGSTESKPPRNGVAPLALTFAELCQTTDDNLVKEEF